MKTRPEVKIHKMGMKRRFTNFTTILVPFLATMGAGFYSWKYGLGILSKIDFFIMFGLYFITGLGVTVGYHRLLTHRAFKTYKPVEYILVTIGSLSVQGSAISWAADHRKHHLHTDKEGDPHSPHLDKGFTGYFGTLMYSHFGWLLYCHAVADWKLYARDLYDDKGIRIISRCFHGLCVASLLLPALIGFMLTGTWRGASTALFWGGIVRIFLIHHITWSINSICHYYGTRRFPTDDKSTNVYWLAIPSFGEAWHNNHHAFPRSAEHGLQWWEIDLSASLITAMEKVGLAWDVVRFTPASQAAREAGFKHAIPE